MAGCPADINLLDELIDRYDFVEFDYASRSCPILYTLKYGKLRMPIKIRNRRDNLERYGFQNPQTFKLLDHFYVFRTKEKKVFLVTNPYFSDVEMRNLLQSLVEESYVDDDSKSACTFKQFYGSYKDLKWDILGKSKSYYYPGSTNLVVLYV